MLARVDPRHGEAGGLQRRRQRKALVRAPRCPRETLLNRWSDVDEQGNFNFTITNRRGRRGMCQGHAAEGDCSSPEALAGLMRSGKSLYEAWMFHLWDTIQATTVAYGERICPDEMFRLTKAASSGTRKAPAASVGETGGWNVFNVGDHRSEVFGSAGKDWGRNNWKAKL
ncbi:hypothetical protein BDV93DRAFT_509754 [Ceratobasidium sp. AG-I]|nr:hypothetical protein BDV93DRAFT_509754 [Ceratobasidium sp. AG-I]